eukprot:s552_g27.t1
MNLADASIATGPLAQRSNLTRPSWNAKVCELLGNTRKRPFLRFAGLAIYGFVWRSKTTMRGSKAQTPRQHNEEIQRLLTPMIRSSRLERAKEVLSQRNQATRLVFCSLYEADVIACLRTMDLFGIQFGEIIGEWTETPGDTSGGAKSYVTLRHWPDLRSCVGWLTEAGYKCILLDNDASMEVKAGLKNIIGGQCRLAVFLADQRQSMQELRSLCELRVHLPQRGFSKSLSFGVSVAALLSYLRSAGFLSGDPLDEGQKHLLWTHWLLELRGQRTSRKLLKEKGLSWPEALK